MIGVAHFESLAPLLAREGGLRLYSRDFQSPGTWLIAQELAVGLTPDGFTNSH
jgi:hypothetical protein